jgi:hypothetical protein
LNISVNICFDYLAFVLFFKDMNHQKELLDDNSSQNDNDNESEFLEAENGDENELLCLTDSPITFEPISSLTNVFFDRDNQQIFCVRSNGVGGK